MLTRAGNGYTQLAGCFIAYSLYTRFQVFRWCSVHSLVRSLNACSNRQLIPTLFFSYFCPGRVVGFTRSGVQLLLCPLPVRHYPAWSVFQPSCYPIISLPNRHNYFQSLLYPSLWSRFDSGSPSLCLLSALNNAWTFRIWSLTRIKSGRWRKHTSYSS